MITGLKNISKLSIAGGRNRFPKLEIAGFHIGLQLS